MDFEHDLLSPHEAKNIECGTVACAAGHLVNIALPFHRESWNSFIARVAGIHLVSDAWVWLFHEDWVRTDNTALGASKRIRHFLDNGAPNNVYAQMRGDAPLCY